MNRSKKKLINRISLGINNKRKKSTWTRVENWKNGFEIKTKNDEFIWNLFLKLKHYTEKHVYCWIKTINKWWYWKRWCYLEFIKQNKNVEKKIDYVIGQRIRIVMEGKKKKRKTSFWIMNCFSWKNGLI